MSSSKTTPFTSNTSSLCPVANSMMRRVSFGAMLIPERFPDSRTTYNTTSRTSSKTSEQHRTLCDHAAAKPPTDSMLDKFVPAEKIKSMSDLDREEEA